MNGNFVLLCTALVFSFCAKALGLMLRVKKSGFTLLQLDFISTIMDQATLRMLVGNRPYIRYSEWWNRVRNPGWYHNGRIHKFRW